MTAPRKDSHSTEFGLWLRKQPEIDSDKGYLAMNIDYLWCNYKSGAWMLIEEKRYMSTIKRWQNQLFGLIDKCAQNHPRYKGFHIIQFENTSPDDGKIVLDSKEITKEQLIKFLSFEPLILAPVALPDQDI